MYSQDLIDAVLKAADIVAVISSYINVEKKGRSYVALCPFHDDKHPSLSISKEKQIFKCFVCGTAGNAITFVQRYEKISYPEAVRKVAEIANFHDPRLKDDAPKFEVDESIKRLYDCIDDLQKYYAYALQTEEAEKARQYLAKRNLGPDQISKYQIGYAPANGANTVKFLQAKGHSLKAIEDIGIALARSSGTSDHNAGRLIFPLLSPFGQVVGFSARQLEKDGTAKYINSPETPIFHKGEILYNYHNAAATARRDGYIYLLEGFMDVMALDKAGIGSAVAIMGTSLTPEQVKLLKKLRCEVRFCLDGDAPGQTAMMNNGKLLRKEGIPFRIVDYEGDLRDPDDILQEEGAEALKKRMNTLIDNFDFQLNFYLNTKKLDKAEDKRKVLNVFLPRLKAMPVGIEQENYIIKLSRATGYEPEAIRQYLRSAPDAEVEGLDEVILAEDRIREGFTKHPEKAYMKKLKAAEGAMLKQMLQNPEAVDYFEKNVRSFYNDVYEELANYILEYRDAHRGDAISPSAIISQIEQSDTEMAGELTNEIANLSMTPTRKEPYSESLMDNYAKIIQQEKASVRDHMAAEKAARAGGKDAGEAIKNLAERRKLEWEKRAKKK
ncbi:MAG: DNA primase [Bacilli bacterium]|nr:DNA primase [Bacilli bacterium]